uniref:Reverse transcriptase domain-containing protein n=1 Tax=Oryzias latipes TaxID=8090 RepID=A0A3B3HFB5_ORYLA
MQKRAVRLSNQRNLVHIPCKKVLTKETNLKLAALNVRSLCNKSFLINNLISSFNLDFMFLTETWLDKNTGNIVLVESTPPNYKHESEIRENKKGGGVSALFRDNIATRRLSFGVFSSFEYVSFKIELKQTPPLLCIVMYKPPQHSQSFIDDFTEMLSVVCTDFDGLVITGDFNVHVDNVNDRNAKELNAVLKTFGLIQHVSCPTHSRGHTLDLLITRGVTIYNVSVVDVALSDHFCVFFDLSVAPKPPPGPAVVQRRQINESTRAQFVEMINPENVSGANVDEMLNSVTSSILNVLDAIAPMKVQLRKHRQKAPWRNDDLVRAQKQQCRRAERKWRKSKLQVHYGIYKAELYAYNQILCRTRERYFSEIIGSCSSNSRILFTTVNRLTNPPTQLPIELVCTPKCNEFAVFFNDKVQGIKKAINSTTHITIERPPTHSKLTHFIPVTDQTVQETITRLSSSTCCLDVLPTRFLKSVLNSVLPSITQIVNMSLQSGIFPEALKTAVIKPLLKKSGLDPTVLNNYRPISNLPFLGKVLEKVVYQQLTDFLLLNNSFDVFQSGFRPHHSTETALIKVTNDIRLNTDDGKVSVLILLDLSAAFDTVDHGILLHRLQDWVGISGSALSWLKSYLEDRKYFVEIGSCVSDYMGLNCGVPQGSILGPLLFNLYMLPLGQLIRSNNISYHNYADDTQIYVSLRTGEYGPVDSLNHCLQQISAWMQNNFLQLNSDKTEVIVFGPQKQREIVSSYLHSLSLKPSNQVRNLGVIMDSDLNFNSHIKSVTSAAFYHLKNIAKIKNIISKRDLEILIHAFVSSRLDYCNGLLTGLSKRAVKQLQYIQNAAARVLTKTRKYDHIGPVLRSLHWLPVPQRIDFKAALLVYKSLHGHAPKYISDMLVPYEPSRTLRTSGTSLLLIPRVRTKQGESAFQYSAAKIWNSLPEVVRQASSVFMLKSRLKTFLFSRVYD